MSNFKRLDYRVVLLFIGLISVATILTVPVFKTTNSSPAKAESNEASQFVQTGGCGVPGQILLAQANGDECGQDVENECGSCKECIKGNCVYQCNRDYQKCDGGDCVNVCDPEEKPEGDSDTCYRCDFESGKWVDTPPSACHKCVNGNWLICPKAFEACIGNTCEECQFECRDWDYKSCEPDFDRNPLNNEVIDADVTCLYEGTKYCVWSNDRELYRGPVEKPTVTENVGESTASKIENEGCSETLGCDDPDNNNCPS